MKDKGFLPKGTEKSTDLQNIFLFQFLIVVNPIRNLITEFKKRTSPKNTPAQDFSRLGTNYRATGTVITGEQRENGQHSVHRSKAYYSLSIAFPRTARPRQSIHYHFNI